MTSFAENYQRFATDPARDGATPALFMAQAALMCPTATDEELEVLARQLMPRDFALIEACADIQAAGGAA